MPRSAGGRFVGFGHNAGLITFRRLVEPSPAEIYQDIMELERRVSDYSKPLRWAKIQLVKDTHRAFHEEKDPISDFTYAWPPWSEKYGKFVTKRGQTKKLQRTWTYPTSRDPGPPGRLFKAATSARNYRITKTGIQFAVERLPHYWIFHQQPSAVGGRRVKQRRLNTKSRAFISARDKHANTWMKENGGAYLQKLKFDHPDWTAAQLVAATKERALEWGTTDASTELAKNLGLNLTETGELVSKRRGNPIPQRRFIGPSPRVSERIQEAFDAWANDTVIFFHRSDSIVMRRK